MPSQSTALTHPLSRAELRKLLRFHTLWVCDVWKQGQDRLPAFYAMYNGDPLASKADMEGATPAQLVLTEQLNATLTAATQAALDAALSGVKTVMDMPDVLSRAFDPLNKRHTAIRAHIGEVMLAETSSKGEECNAVPAAPMPTSTPGQALRTFAKPQLRKHLGNFGVCEYSEPGVDRVHMFYVFDNFEPNVSLVGVEGASPEGTVLLDQLNLALGVAAQQALDAALKAVKVSVEVPGVSSRAFDPKNPRHAAVRGGIANLMHAEICGT